MMATPSPESQATPQPSEHADCCAARPRAPSAASETNERAESRWTRRVRLLVAATISYNVVEAVVAISAGILASSAALLSFGLDSVIEVSSAAAVAWQVSARDREVRQARERTALRIIAISFFALAGYVTVQSIRTLAGAGAPEPSLVGIVLAALSLVVMPVLSLAQRRAGRRLGSASTVADSKQTLICGYLSGVLLIGLVLNAALGWSWADPIVALLIAAVAAREGRQAWRGKGCCAPGSAAMTAHHAEEDDCCADAGNTRK